MPETSSTRLGDERLLVLAAALERIPESHFNIDKLYLPPGCERLIRNAANGVVEPNCGSAVCALGFCPAVFPDEWEWTRDGTPMHDHKYSFAAAEMFFDIDELESGMFTHQHDNKTPTALAAKIRKFVEGRQR